MLRKSLIFLTLACVLSATVVVDRVAIIVGTRVVKASDIDQDLRASQFMNSEPLNVSSEMKRKVADRLIIQELVRQEMLIGGYSQPNERDAEALLQQQVRDRFKGSETEFRGALSRYGLTDDQLRRYLLWQLTVLRFIDERFRPGVLVTDEDVRDYYEKHRAELQKANPKNASLEALEPKIHDIVAGERVNQNFEEWIEETRRRVRVEMRDAAFGDAGSRPGVSK